MHELEMKSSYTDEKGLNGRRSRRDIRGEMTDTMSWCTDIMD